MRVAVAQIDPKLGEKERNLVILEKVRETPAEYPRRSGVATKRPLGAG